MPGGVGIGHVWHLRDQLHVMFVFSAIWLARYSRVCNARSFHSQPALHRRMAQACPMLRSSPLWSGGGKTPALCKQYMKLCARVRFAMAAARGKVAVARSERVPDSVLPHYKELATDRSLSDPPIVGVCWRPGYSATLVGAAPRLVTRVCSASLLTHFTMCRRLWHRNSS